MEEKADGNYRKYQLNWCRTWRPYCIANNIADPWAYNLADGVECLCEVHDHNAATNTEAGKAVQHSVAKEFRATMNYFWALGNIKNPTYFTNEYCVQAVFIGLRRTAPLLAKNQDIWQSKLVFNKIFDMAKGDHDRASQLIIDLPHSQMRPWLLMLLKLKIGARSGDIGPTKDDHGGLYRYFWPEEPFHERQGLMGDFMDNDVRQIRFWRNKTIAAKQSLYTKFHDLGDFLEDTTEFPFMSAACPRRLLNKYLEITDGLPRSDDLVFIASKRSRTPAGRLKFAGISSQTVANDVGGIMTLCGVPARFTPHSTRAVTLSSNRDFDKMRGIGNSEFLKKIDVSEKVFRIFYDKPFSDDVLAPGEAAALTGARRPKKLTWPSHNAVTDGGPRPGDPSPPGQHALDAITVDAVTYPMSPHTSDDEAAETDFDVHSIVDMEIRTVGSRGKKETFYKVHWLGCSTPEDTWEPMSSLTDCKAAIVAYENSVQAKKALSQRQLPKAPPTRHPPRGKAATSSAAVAQAGRVRGKRVRFQTKTFEGAASVRGDTRSSLRQDCLLPNRPRKPSWRKGMACFASRLPKRRDVLDHGHMNEAPIAATHLDDDVELYDEPIATSSALSRLSSTANFSAAAQQQPSSGRKRPAAQARASPRKRAKTAFFKGEWVPTRLPNKTPESPGSSTRGQGGKSRFVRCPGCGQPVQEINLDFHLDIECQSASDPQVVD